MFKHIYHHKPFHNIVMPVFRSDSNSSKYMKFVSKQVTVLRRVKLLDNHEYVRYPVFLNQRMSSKFLVMTKKKRKY